MVEELQQSPVERPATTPVRPTAPSVGQTEAAVVAFQEANGLSVDGRVGPETAAALNGALAGG